MGALAGDFPLPCRPLTERNAPALSAPASTSRIPSLDGLRAISIAMVLGEHAGGTQGFPEAWAQAWPYFFSGSLGVKCFFVLSGYLITSLLLKEEAKFGRISLADFYRRRVLRIFPVYYLFLVTVLVLNRFTSLQVAPSAFVAAGTFTTPLWGEPHYVLFHTWSLSVEEQFYLLWPLVLCLTTGRARWWVAASVVALVPVIRLLVHLFGPRKLIGYFSFTQGDALMFGCLLALYQQRPLLAGVAALPRLDWRHRLGALAAIYSVWMLSHHGRLGPLTVPFGGTMQSAALALLIASYLTPDDSLGFRWLNAAFMRWVGVLSYSLYLWQQLFLYPRQAAWMILQQFPVNLLATLAVAALSYYTVESAFLRLKDRFHRAPAAT